MSIRNDDELAQARNALATLHRALAALRRDVHPLNPRNYAVLAEGATDEIARIESEVSEYLER